MNRLRLPSNHWQRLLPVLFLALALAAAGATVPDLQPVKEKEAAGFSARAAVDAAAPGFSKTGLVLHVAEGISISAPALAPPVLFTPDIAVFASCSLLPPRSRAPPSPPVLS